MRILLTNYPCIEPSWGSGQGGEEEGDCQLGAPPWVRASRAWTPSWGNSCLGCVFNTGLLSGMTRGFGKYHRAPQSTDGISSAFVWRGWGVVGTISSSSHLTGSLLPRICMTSACCHLENFSSLRKSQHLSFTNLCPSQRWESPFPPGKQRAKGKSIRWTRLGGGRLHRPWGKVRESGTCWSNPEEVWTGLALQSGLGQWSPSPLEHEFVYMPAVGGRNVERGRRKLKQVPPFPWPPLSSSVRPKADHTPRGSIHGPQSCVL